MFKEFPTWFGLLDLEPTEEAVRKRWDEVVVAATNPTPVLILNAVQLLRRSLSAPASEWAEQLSERFRNSNDSLFGLSSGRSDLEIVAGAALREIMDANDGDIGIVAMLAIQTGSFLAKSPSPILEKVLPYAKAAQVNLGIRQRNESLGGVITLHEPAPLEPAPNPTVQATAINDALVSLIKCINEVLEGVGRDLQLRAEETDLMWSLVSGYSQRLNRPFSSLSPATAAVLLGCEMAASVRVLPGPARSIGILASALSKSGHDPEMEISLEELVTNTNADAAAIAASAAPNEMVPLCSIAAAFALHKASAGAVGWAGVVEGQQGVVATQKRQLIDYAVEMYSETLLATTMVEIG